MKAMIFAAGLGSRLKPLTDTMPKALVPIAGHPMLEHVILKLKAAGFTEIVINIHHFGEQILDFLEANENFGLIIHISDERDLLLDTGGGIKKARSFFENSDEPFLIHNVDILSDVNLKELYDYHLRSGAVATLLASQRKTSRYLLFDTDKRLCGWINKDTEQVKPEGFQYDSSLYQEYAFTFSTKLIKRQLKAKIPYFRIRFQPPSLFQQAITKNRRILKLYDYCADSTNTTRFRIG